MVRNVSKNIFLQIIFGETGRRGLRMQPGWTRPRRVGSQHNTSVCVCVFRFIFNWRIIALQYCVGFCHTSTGISHRHSCVPPSWASPTPHAVTEFRSEVPASHGRFPLAVYFARGSAHASALLSQFIQSSSWPTVSTSPLTTPASPRLHHI